MKVRAATTDAAIRGLTSRTGADSLRRSSDPGIEHPHLRPTGLVLGDEGQCGACETIFTLASLELM